MTTMTEVTIASEINNVYRGVITADKSQIQNRLYEFFQYVNLIAKCRVITALDIRYVFQNVGEVLPGHDLSDLNNVYKYTANWEMNDRMAMRAWMSVVDRVLHDNSSIYAVGPLSSLFEANIDTVLEPLDNEKYRGLRDITKRYLMINIK